MRFMNVGKNFPKVGPFSARMCFCYGFAITCPGWKYFLSTTVLTRLNGKMRIMKMEEKPGVFEAFVEACALDEVRFEIIKGMLTDHPNLRERVRKWLQ